MNFKNDIFELSPPSHREFNLANVKIPTNIDVYFRAKQSEIIDQYSAARIYMWETETDDWTHWFDKPEKDSDFNAFKLKLTSFFYESALTYYNVLVDLSWTMCYLSAEYVCKLNNKTVDFAGVKPIDEAYKLLRQAENLVTNPTAENNPFQYLKQMCPDYSDVIDLIINFWTDFSNTNIRKNYNYFKHKGKPSYTELERLQGGRLMGIQVEKDNQRIQVATDIRDVTYKISLEESIKELFDFDNEKLYPYIKNLFEQLEKITQPSPMVT